MSRLKQACRRSAHPPPVLPARPPRPRRPTKPPPRNRTRRPKRSCPSWIFFRLIRLPGLLLIALTQGLIREGISTWFPTILQESGRFAAGSPLLILIVVPLINLGGILFVRRINRRLNGACLQTLLLVFGLVTVCALLLNLFLAQWFWPILLMIVLLLALTYGMTPILTSVIPFQFAQYKRGRPDGRRHRLCHLPGRGLVRPAVRADRRSLCLERGHAVVAGGCRRRLVRVLKTFL